MKKFKVDWYLPPIARKTADSNVEILAIFASGRYAWNAHHDRYGEITYLYTYLGTYAMGRWSGTLSAWWKS